MKFINDLIRFFKRPKYRKLPPMHVSLPKVCRHCFKEIPQYASVCEHCGKKF